MKRLLLVCVVAVGGCATDEIDTFFGERLTSVTLPDGRAGHVVYCERGIDYCYERSRKQCGGNYEVVNRTESTEEVARKIEIVCDA